MEDKVSSCGECKKLQQKNEVPTNRTAGNQQNKSGNQQSESGKPQNRSETNKNNNNGDFRIPIEGQRSPLPTIETTETTHKSDKKSEKSPKDCIIPMDLAKVLKKPKIEQKMNYSYQKLKVDRKENVKKFILANINKLIVFILLVLFVGLIMGVIFQHNTSPVIIFLVGIMGCFLVSLVIVSVGYYYWLDPDE